MMPYRLSLLLLIFAACLGAVSSPAASQTRPRSLLTTTLLTPVLAQAPASNAPTSKPSVSPSPSATEVKPSPQPKPKQVKPDQVQERRRLKGALALLGVSIAGAASVAGAVFLYERGRSANSADSEPAPPKEKSTVKKSLSAVSPSPQAKAAAPIAEAQVAAPPPASVPPITDASQLEVPIASPAVETATLEAVNNGTPKPNPDADGLALSSDTSEGLTQIGTAQLSNGHKSLSLPAATPPQAETTPALNTAEQMVLQELKAELTSPEAPPAPSSPPGSLVVSETSSLAKINPGEALLLDLRSADPEKRNKAVWELGQRGNSQAVQPLVDLMMDADSRQRSLILASLSEIGVRTLKPMSRALAISLQDDSPDVRKNAIRDLTRVYDLVAQISQLLRQAADDPDAEVRETARWALGQLGRIRTAPPIDSATTMPHSVSSPENFSS